MTFLLLLKNNKYKSTWEYDKNDPVELYVGHPYDLRTPCDKKDCPRLSQHISYAKKAGGTWGYAYSKQGAKKFLDVFLHSHHLEDLYTVFFVRVFD